MAGNERFDDSIGKWLEETAPDRLPERVLNAAFERTRRTRQDHAWRAVPGRLQMPRFVPALGGAAVVALATVVALNILRIPGFGGLTPSPSGSPTPSHAADLPVGPHVMVSRVGLNEDPGRVTVTIPAPGWFAEPDEASLTKDLGGDDRVTVVTVPGDHYHVPENICHWQAGTDLVPSIEPVGGLRAHELVSYLGYQTYDTPEGSHTRDLSAPVVITIDGHPGDSVTGAVPDIDPRGCDGQRFCSLLDQDGVECLLPHLEPKALVTFWILDHPVRNLWVVAATHWPTTGSELRAEMNAIVDSMD